MRSSMSAVGTDRLTLLYARMARGRRASNLGCRLNCFAALGTLHRAVRLRRHITEASDPAGGDGSGADAFTTTIPEVALTHVVVACDNDARDQNQKKKKISSFRLQSQHCMKLNEGPLCLRPRTPMNGLAATLRFAPIWIPPTLTPPLKSSAAACAGIEASTQDQSKQTKFGILARRDYAPLSGPAATTL